MPVSYFILCDLWTYVTFGRAVAIRAVNTLPASASKRERQDDVWLSLQPVTFPSSPKVVIAFAYSAQSAIAANKTSGLHKLLHCVGRRREHLGSVVDTQTPLMRSYLTLRDADRRIIPQSLCCARAASGHVAAAPPSSVKNERRFMSSMGDFLPYALSVPLTGPYARFSATISLP